MRFIKMKNIIIPFGFFIIGVFFVVTYTFVDHSFFIQQTMKNSIDTMNKKLVEREKYINKELSLIAKELYSIRDNQLFKDYIDAKYDLAKKEDISYLFEKVIASDQEIMQIRYIGKDGKEKIRFDRLDQQKEDYVLIKELQDKSKRYYFQNSIHKEEKVWFSKLDLNIEHGKIEIPFKSTFRAILPIQSEGFFDGILILNYFAEPLLQRVMETPSHDAILIDSENYILSHFENNKNWSRYQKNSFKFNKESLAPPIVSKELDLPFENRLTMVLQLKKEFKQSEHQFYKTRAIWVIFIFSSITLILSILIYFLLRYFDRQNVSLEILTKEKKEKNELLIQNSKMAAMGEMIANIAHQWRQPLALVSMHCIGLQKRYERDLLDDVYFDNFIAKVNKALDQMSCTIEDFSNFFKPNKEKQSFAIDKVIMEILDLVDKPLRDNNIIVCYNPLETYEFIGYRNELKQILLNIINNSKDAIQLNSIENGKINISIKREENKLIIKIADNGKGIAPEIIKRVFEPYFTTKHKSSGTGIGLYMCKMIIEESFGGSIQLSNQKSGAVCEIILKDEEKVWQ